MGAGSGASRTLVTETPTEKPTPPSVGVSEEGRPWGKEARSFRARSDEEEGRGLRKERQSYGRFTAERGE